MPQHFDIVIFGGTGDLSRRKLLPALYRADLELSLADDTRVFLTTRARDAVREIQNALDELPDYLANEEQQADCLERFRRRIHPQTLDIGNLDQNWEELAGQLKSSSRKTRLFYFAVHPALYGQTSAHLAAMNLITDASRVILEKPIGCDLPSAHAIHSEVGTYLSEDQIYRIDHYLGKETVQNLLALRFANTFFEEMWDSKSIQQVQITVAETLGLEGRAGFYDDVGALRDMIQNHVLQLLALLAMDPPNSLDPGSVRAEKLKVLQALRPIVGEEVTQNTIRGQYSRGKINGTPVPGYCDELGSDSCTETYVALRAHIDCWRWRGVPFLLRTGKRLNRRLAEIVVQYRPVSHRIYGHGAGDLEPNRLIIRLQPEESIQLMLMMKTMKGHEVELRPEYLNLNFAARQREFRPDAYKRLLLDAAAGNPTLFAHREEVEHTWRWVDPILNAWHSTEQTVHTYPAGSWGPTTADTLIEESGSAWFIGEPQT